MFAKKIVSAFIALSFLFVAEAFARKNSRSKDDIERTKISRKLKSGKKSEEKKKTALKAQQLRKRKQAQLKRIQQKKNLELRKKKQAQLKRIQQKKNLELRKKKQVQPKKVKASSKSSKRAPRVFKEPTPYYVKVGDLPKAQQRQAARYMGLKNLPKEGTIKFAHSDLDPKEIPTFEKFLNIKERNRKAKKKNSSEFEVFEYKAPGTFYSSSSEYSNKKLSKKDSNWSWPWQ